MHQRTPIQQGFTLIELLIVVAIIAILAAIAIPNFLAAQIRAKVSRVQAEFHTSTQAIESYHVDNNTYPYYNGRDQQISPTIADDAGPHFLPYTLTTPVAYLSSLFDEIFEGRNTPGNIPKKHEFHYFNYIQSPNFFVLREMAATGNQNNAYAYYLASNGPDLWCNGAGLIVYDPTNGTTSSGDIVRFGP